jgi:hypothetical protein
VADIFVSYARTDKARVAPLVAALASQGWSAWWDPVAWAKVDSDLDPIRDHPRYKAMLAKAEARLASQNSPDDSATKQESG